MKNFDHFVPFAIILLFLALLAAGSGRRRRELRDLARAWDMTYIEVDRDLPIEIQGLYTVGRGSAFAANVMRGSYRGYETLLFDSRFDIGTGREQVGTFFALCESHKFPPFRIYPKGLAWRIGELVGSTDIQLDSVEFSNAFVVQSTDDRFAYSICHPRFMEVLLEHPRTAFEIGDGFIIMTPCEQVAPDMYAETLDLLIELRELFPRYLEED